MSREQAMRRHPSMRAVWTPADYDTMVDQLHALAHAVVNDLHAELGTPTPPSAPVVDLFTREVIA